MVATPSPARRHGAGVFNVLMLSLGAAFLVVTSYLLLQEAVKGLGSSGSDGKAGMPVSLGALERLSPGELADAAQEARNAFAADPLDAAAVIDLSRIAEARGDAEASERLKLIAGQMAPRLTRIQAEALTILLRRRDFDAVMDRLDGLIRARPREADRLFAVAAGIARDADGAKAVARMMARNPPWRRQFLAAMIATGEAETAYRVMGELSAINAPVEASEIRSVIDHHLKAGDVDRAYAVWLSSLSEDELKDVRLIYDGGFSHPLKGLRFDWTVTPADGLTQRLFPRNTASMDQTLQLDFVDVTGTINHLSQILRLRPGRHRLSGEIRFENFVSPTGLVFRLYCLAGSKATPLDQTASLPQSTQWIGFERTFEVPDSGCNSQLLQLESQARLENTQITRGMVAIDALNIDNLPTLAP